MTSGAPTEQGHGQDRLHAERERVAATLGAVLRKAFLDHVQSHGCGTEELPIFSCPDGYRLWHLRPEGDQIALA